MKRALRILAVLLAVVVVLVAALLGALASDRLLMWAAPRGAQMAGFELRTTRIEHDLGSRLALHGITLAKEGHPPLVEAAALEVRYGLASLARGVLEIAAITIEEPTVALVFLEDGSLEGFPPAAEPAEKPAPSDTLLPLPPMVRIAKVDLSRGKVLVDQRASARRVSLEGIALAADGAASPRQLEATLDVERAVLGAESVGPLALRAKVDGKTVTLPSLELALGGGRLGVEGSWDAGSGAIDASARLDHIEPAPILAALAVTAEVPRSINGTLGLKGKLPDALEASADLGGSFREEALEVDLSAQGSLKQLTKVALDARWAGLEALARGRIDLEGDSTELDLEAKSDSIDFVKAFVELPELEGRAPYVSARVTGALERPKVEVRELRLESLTLPSASLARLRASAQIEAPDGPLAATLTFDDLRASGTLLGAGRVTASGTLARPEARIEVGKSIAGQARYDRATGHAAVQATIDDLPLAPFLETAGVAGVRGTLGHLAADLAGDPKKLETLRGHATVESLLVEAEGARIATARPIEVVLADDVARFDVGLRTGKEGALDATGTVKPSDRALEASIKGKLALAELRAFARGVVPDLQTLGGRIELEGTARGTIAKPDLDVVAAVRDVLAERGAPDAEPEKRLRIALPRLDVAAKGPLDRLTGHAELSGGSALAAGRSVGDLEAQARMNGGAIELEKLAFVAEGVHFQGRGSLAADRRLEASLETVDGRLEAIPDALAAELSGGLSIVAQASGRLPDPTVTVKLAVTDLELRETPLGPLSLDAALARRRLTASGTLPGGGHLEAQAALDAPRRFRAETDIPDFTLEPVFGLLRDSLPPALQEAKGRLALRGNVAGTLDDLKSLQGTVTLAVLDVDAAGTTVRLEQPAQLAMRGTSFDLPELAIRLGEGGRVRAQARSTAGRVEGSVGVDLDPPWISTFLTGVELGAGKVHGEVRFGWADGALRAEGPLEASVSSVQVRGLPDSLTNLELKLALEDETFELEKLSGNLGDGEFSGTARGSLRDRTLGGATLSFVGIPYRVPGTLRVLSSGNIEAKGSAEALVVAGTVRIDEALYDREVQVFEEVIRPISGKPGKRPAKGRAESSKMLERVRLDLKIASGDTMAVRNNVAKITAGADLSVRGTAARPELLGEVRVAEGEVRFFDRTFEVTNGTVDFENPLEIDPRVSIATLSIVEHGSEEVEVRLGLEGTVSKGLALTLTSEPSYPQDDIAFLLATGQTREEALEGGGGGGPSMTGLSLAALSLLGGDAVKEKLGVDEFGLAEGEGGAAQVTVGKRLSDRMRVRAVNELGRSISSVALAIDYQLTDRVFFVAEPRSTGAVGAEVRVRFVFL